MTDRGFAWCVGAYRLVLGVMGVLVVAFCALGVVSSAWAVEYDFGGAYASFDDCPLSDVSLDTCIVADIGGGMFTVGRRTIAIDARLALKGGLIADEAAPTGIDFVAAEDRDTLSKTVLSVPGGLSGVLAAGVLPRSLRETFDHSIQEDATTAVTATAELAGPASMIELSIENLGSGEGVALQLPLKVRLSNPFLGADCYIGSSASPIVLKLTTGTTTPPAPNNPISGASGQLSFLENGSVGVLNGISLVDNAFAVPAANGCGGTSSALVDRAVDAELGLPSTAGHNTAILNTTVELSSASVVRDEAE